MAGEINNEQIWPMLDGAVLGGLGGLVNNLRGRSGYSWGQLCVSVLTAAFAGMMAQLLVGWMEADIRLQFATAGIAGYGGGVLLDDAVARLRGLMNGAANVIEKAAGERK